MTAITRVFSSVLNILLICALLAIPAHAASMKQAKKAIAENNIEGAINELLPLANSGNSAANNMLGELYLNGTGVSQDTAQAKIYFEAGARTGHLDSLKNLNIILDTEYKQELLVVRPAAEGGDSQAQTRLGRMYEFGYGQNASPKDAFIWYNKAAAQDNLAGAMNLARAYNFGIGVAQDLIKAEAGYLAAAQRGHVDSMFFLGTMHFAQLSQAGNDADRQAYAWLRLASDNGHAAATAMVTRLKIKLNDQLTTADALYKEFKQAYDN
ncbi:MAG: sel1 repeat family protein [Gammaproteobacteria bacterium]|nr:sel1 repeat family protein [Gammaproteobacteria bacterium]MCP4879387.1 sel1 repeat family protein [Gammaproteobacteria bacterium]